MKKEKEQMLAMILNKPEVPRKFSHRLIEQHINCMDPQDEDMRSFLWAYLSASTASESQVIYSTKIASLSENKRQKFVNDFLQCLTNDATAWKKSASLTITN